MPKELLRCIHWVLWSHRHTLTKHVTLSGTVISRFQAAGHLPLFREITASSCSLSLSLITSSQLSFKLSGMMQFAHDSVNMNQ